MTLVSNRTQPPPASRPTLTDTARLPLPDLPGGKGGNRTHERGIGMTETTTLTPGGLPDLEGLDREEGPPFGTILADCPWRWQNWNSSERAKRGEKWAKRNGRSPYDVLDTDTLAALPVREIAAKDAVLLLWATWPMLPDALQVMAGWGFTFKSGLPWIKMTRAACPRVGLGFHVRSCSELLLIGTRGSPGVPPPDARPLGAIFCPIGEHSAKPAQQYEIAEGYPGPWLELFARPKEGMFGPRAGWVQLGDEATGNDIREDLRRIRQGEPQPGLFQEDAE